MIKDKKTTIGYHCPFCGTPILNKVDIFSMSNKLLRLRCPCKQGELVLQITKDNKVRITVPCIICPVTHTFTLSSNTFFEKELFFLTCTFTAIGICFFGRSDKVINSMKENEDELIEMFKAYDEYNDGEEEDYAYTEGFRKVGEEEKDNIKNFGDDFFMDDDDDDDFDDFHYFDDFEEDKDDEFDWNDFLDDFIESMGKQGNPNDKTENDNQGFEIYKNNCENDGGVTIDADEKILLDRIKIRSPVIFEQIMSIIYKFLEEKKIYCLCDNPKNFDGAMTIKEDKIILECKICGAKREIKAKIPADLEYFYDIDAIYLD